jgi:hypothetical protein
MPPDTSSPSRSSAATHAVGGVCARRASDQHTQDSSCALKLPASRSACWSVATRVWVWVQEGVHVGLKGPGDCGCTHTLCRSTCRHHSTTNTRHAPATRTCASNAASQPGGGRTPSLAAAHTRFDSSCAPKAGICACVARSSAATQRLGGR